MSVCTKLALLARVHEPVLNTGCKVTVVGAGSVGMACAISILTQGICNNVVLFDSDEDKSRAEMMELQHGSSFINNAKVISTKDYEATACSKVCVITAGARHKIGETRLDLVERNCEVIKEIVPNLVKHSPDTLLLVITNPVDIMSYVAWKFSGLDHSRVIGTGTSLDSARFKFFIGDKLGIPPTSVHAWVIGEHGDSSVPVWSGVSVAGVRLRDLNAAMGTDDDSEDWKQVHKEVVAAGYQIIKLKGYTSWAVGLCAASIVNSILNNINNIVAVSTLIKKYHGISHNVYASLPVQIGYNGVTNVIIQKLDRQELCALKNSTAVISQVQNSLKL